MLVTEMAKTVTNILKLSPTHFVPNIDVAEIINEKTLIILGTQILLIALAPLKLNVKRAPEMSIILYFQEIDELI